MASKPSENEFEEEFLRGDQKPCWCCTQNLKTAALLVAVLILYSHCIVAFVLITFFVIDYDDKVTLKNSEDYRTALLVEAGASFAYVPVGFCLLVGIVKNRLWMCIIWFWVMVIGTMLDFSMWAVDQTVQLIVFDVVFLMLRFYFLYVIWAYISVAKKQRQLQEAWENLAKSTTVSAVSVLTPKDEETGLGEGDSRMALGEVDADDDLSHDSVMERIQASETSMLTKTAKTPNITFKSLNQNQ